MSFLENIFGRKTPRALAVEGVRTSEKALGEIKEIDGPVQEIELLARDLSDSVQSPHTRDFSPAVDKYLPEILTKINEAKEKYDSFRDKLKTLIRDAKQIKKKAGRVSRTINQEETRAIDSIKRMSRSEDIRLLELVFSRFDNVVEIIHRLQGRVSNGGNAVLSTDEAKREVQEIYAETRREGPSLTHSIEQYLETYDALEREVAQQLERLPT